jgi:VWFA-related protein
MTRVARCVLVAVLGATAPLGTSRPSADQTVFRTAVDTVILDVLVMQGNRAVAGLTAKDFVVTDNGVPQSIVEVSRETLPLDVTLVIDTSGSVQGRLLAALVRAVNRVRRDLRDDDRVSLVSFDQRIRERVALAPTPSVAELRLDTSSGPTSLNDAIAIVLATAPPTDRRQMAIVFTDGIDSMSFLDEQSVIDVAGRSRTAVFVVAAAGLGVRVPTEFFTRLADATGGLLQTAPPYVVVHESGRTILRQNEDFLDQSFLRALRDFRTSYVVRYNLQGVKREGWHAVRVTVPSQPRARIRSRTGYFGG